MGQGAAGAGVGGGTATRGHRFFSGEFPRDGGPAAEGPATDHPEGSLCQQRQRHGAGVQGLMNHHLSYDSNCDNALTPAVEMVPTSIWLGNSLPPAPGAIRPRRSPRIMWPEDFHPPTTLCWDETWTLHKSRLKAGRQVTREMPTGILTDQSPSPGTRIVYTGSDRMADNVPGSFRANRPTQGRR